jgi:hypothetical protein
VHDFAGYQHQDEDDRKQDRNDRQTNEKETHELLTRVASVLAIEIFAHPSVSLVVVIEINHRLLPRSRWTSRLHWRPR